MIEFTTAQIDVIRIKLQKTIKRTGFDASLVHDLLPTKAPAEHLNTTLNLFLAIGINGTGMSTKMRNAMTYVKIGIDRFFSKLQARKELRDVIIRADKQFPNAYSGRHNLALDYYVAPAIFDAETIPSEVIALWNFSLRHLKIWGHHGIQLLVFYDDTKSIDEIKYVWANRYVK